MMKHLICLAFLFGLPLAIPAAAQPGPGGGDKSKKALTTAFSMSPATSPQDQETVEAQIRAYPKTVSAGLVNGKATRLVKPVYPADAKAAGAYGIVSVRVIIDEYGKVISAVAAKGHPLLRAAAETAARQSIFSKPMISGQQVKETGIVIYRFPK